MFIKDIILDGFKCYENITVIRNLDKSYNAITGLNGSGKSNIIDAIVFALGLESKKLLRATTMKDLINTHRKDCKVTLVLSNKDKDRSPIGYKDYDEITICRFLDITGKSKYFLNNHVCTNSTITKFCSSIGIHSEKNSPFIVMQGHITKVLNMKSKEIGTLIEETAGTRSYTKEKEKALQVLEKKEIKLKNVRDAMERRIGPFYERLSQEREAFIEQKIIEEKKKKSQEEIGRLKDLLEQAEASKALLSLKETVEEYVTDCTNLKSIEEELLRLQTDDYTGDSVGLKAELEDERIKLDEYKQKQKEYERNEGKMHKQKTNKFNEHEKTQPTLEDLKEKEKIILENIRASGGIFGDSNRIQTLEELAILESRKVEVAYKLNHIKIDKDFDEKKIHALERLKADEDDLRSKTGRLEYLKSRINYPFVEGVFGSVGENIRVLNEKHTEAIHTILGNKARHIIVIDEKVGANLLKGADRRISVIPLNKIIVKLLKVGRVKGGVQALDLVAFDLPLKKAVEHVLGNFYVFEKKEEAQKACFESNVLCVTLDGVVYDPKGTVTGGKSAVKVEIVTRKEIESLEDEIREIKANDSKFRREKSTYERLISQRNLKKEEEALKEEVRALDVKIGTLKRIAENGDLKADLDSVRKEILRVAAEEKKNKEMMHKQIEIEKELEQLKEQKKENDKQIEECIKKIKTLEEKVKMNEVQKSTRRMSEKQVEGLEPKQKHLIRTTTRLKNKIRKIYEEIESRKTESRKGKHKGMDRDTGKSRSIGNNEGIHENESEEEVDLHENKTNKSLHENKINFTFLVDEDWISTYLDFVDFIDPQIFDQRIIKLTEDQEKEIITNLNMSKENLRTLGARKSIRMDPSNFSLLEKYDHDIRALKEKIDKIEKDKEKILKSITNFDTLGIKEIDKAFKHINKKLGAFLRYFLVNSDAKIVKEGFLYELKVKIGNWKDSLIELSGGQRSLVALCLIFSMLTYKPAPFYIFDEIDAALDLSYTQSIGEIIKKEFDSAQFLVISLKNGMYDNANSVFKVFIKDGKSKIAQIK